MRSAAILLVIPLLAAGAEAKKLRMTKEHHVSLELRSKSPTFYGFEPTILVDDGRLLAIGKGIGAEQGTFHFLDLDKLEEKTITLDVDAWFASHASAFPRSGKGPLDAGFVETPLFVDSSRGSIGVAVHTAGQHGLYLLVADLDSGKVTSQVLLGRTGKDQVISCEPLHYSDGKLYTLVSLSNMDGKTEGIVMRVGDGEPSELARIKANHGFVGAIALDLQRHRVFVPRYAVADTGVKASSGAIIDLETGAVQELTIPTTTYGAVFSDDGTILFTYSSDTGMLWKIDVASGEKVAELKVGKLGFPVGFFAPNRLAVLRNSTLVEVDPVAMTKTTTLQLKTLAKGFWHTEGSFFIGSTGRVVVQNGRDLYLVRLSEK